MSIQKFYSAATANDFARLFQFKLLTWSIGNNNFNLSDNGELIYCETASLPGRSINNIPVPFMGLSFNVPGTVAFPGSAAWNVVFRCDANYAIRSQFEQELTRLFSVSDTTGGYSLPDDSNYIEMALLGKGDVATTTEGAPPVIRTYKLVGPYVVSLQDTQYDVKDTGQVALINATIAYQYWTSSVGSVGGNPPTTLATGSGKIFTGPTTGQQTF